MRISPFCGKLAALLPLAALSLALAYPLCAQSGFAWNITEQEDTPYIPLEDLRSFYKFAPLDSLKGETGQVIGNNATRLEFGPGERDLRIQGYKLQLSKPLRHTSSGETLLSQEDLGKLIDPILRPVYIANREEVKTVIIDPGHGGHDTGARNNTLREADFTQLMARALAEELRKRNYQVILTQDSNSFRSNQQRVEIANRQQNAIFISLHLNSGRSDQRGVQTYTTAPAAYGEPPVPGNEHDAANAALAFAVQSSLVARTNSTDAGIKRAHYSLLSSLNCPAVLVELGYITHEEECAALQDENHRQALCTALADGIDTYAATMKPDAVMHPVPATGFTPPSTYEEEAPAADSTPAGKQAEADKNSRSQASSSTKASKRSRTQSTSKTRRSRATKSSKSTKSSRKTRRKSTRRN